MSKKRKKNQALKELTQARTQKPTRIPVGPEVIYLRRLVAREVRHSANPEEVAAEAEYRCELTR